MIMINLNTTLKPFIRREFNLTPGSSELAKVKNLDLETALDVYASIWD